MPPWIGVLTLIGPLLVLASSAGRLLTTAVPFLPLGRALILLALRAGSICQTAPHGSTDTEPPTI